MQQEFCTTWDIPIETGAMTKISAFLRGSAHKCTLVLTFSFMVCEIVVGQICGSLLIAVDSFHTLYVFINMVLCASKHHPTNLIANPHLSSTCLSEPHKSHLPISTTTLGSSEPASGPLGKPRTLPHGEPYSRMRLKPFGILVSALLLASQCISVSLEILTRLVQPESIQHPLLSIVVGATSLLFNTLMLTWRWRRREMNEADDERIQPDLHSTSESTETALQNDALMFCNPEAPSVLDPDQSSHDCSSTCSELQNHNITKPLPELGHAQISKSNMCESSQEVLQPTEQLSEEHSCMPPHEQGAHHTSQHTPAGSRFRRHLINVIQNLLGPALILVNGLVLLLIKPHCHRPHSDCHPLVYFDTSFSILVVLVLLATALPKLHRYGLLVLQATPLHVCINEVRDSLAGVPGVLSVHELHVWQLSDTFVVASVHVHCPKWLNEAGCSDLMLKITRVLSTFGINHCTVQPEFLLSDMSDDDVVNSDEAGPIVDSGCSLRCGQECAEKLCCSSRVEKSCQHDSVTSFKKDLRVVCPQEESFCSPAPSSVSNTGDDVIIENTYL
ncbi:uncharacterized protein [Paramisgurnus dabryanus]|uniref:uncharacterized protein n=1 Tax=Paramisgurnus dabryanus TaxID=90735 RepID=UPI0031F37921